MKAMRVVQIWWARRRRWFYMLRAAKRGEVPFTEYAGNPIEGYRVTKLAAGPKNERGGIEVKKVFYAEPPEISAGKLSQRQVAAWRNRGRVRHEAARS